MSLFFRAEHVQSLISLSSSLFRLYKHNSFQFKAKLKNVSLPHSLPSSSRLLWPRNFPLGSLWPSKFLLGSSYLGYVPVPLKTPSLKTLTSSYKLVDNQIKIRRSRFQENSPGSPEECSDPGGSMSPYWYRMLVQCRFQVVSGGFL